MSIENSQQRALEILEETLAENAETGEERESKYVQRLLAAEIRDQLEEKTDESSSPS